MQGNIDILESTREELVTGDINKILPVFYCYAVCKPAANNKSIMPLSSNLLYNTSNYSTHCLYKPIINNFITLNLPYNE